MSSSDHCLELARRVIASCEAQGLRLATAESCTGGLVAAALTEIPGSSAAVEGGAVVYENGAKMRLLQVSAETLERHGAVSEATAVEMARGARQCFEVGLSVAVTGIAGPGGGSAEKPVGLVHLAVSLGEEILTRRVVLPGSRREVRERTVEAALALMLEALGAAPPTDAVRSA